MKSRLGFAISVHVDPDILNIDEALSVGDKAFSEKSLDQMKEFKQQGKTMIFVSHSLGQMKQFCEKILWLEYGMVRDFGPVKEVIPKYEAFLNSWKDMSKKERTDYRDAVFKYQQKTLENPSKDRAYKTWIGNKLLTKTEESYKETFTSRLCHIRGGESYIYSSPKNVLDKKPSHNYKNRVYFIKKQATYNGELFYLLSNHPSATKGVIGWMKAATVASHVHVAIHNDPLMFYVKGTGSGYSR